MADAVTTQILDNGGRNYTVILTNLSDGTGEIAVVKIDKSTLTTIGGDEPSALKIVDIAWVIQGFDYVKLAFDHTADDTALVLAGNGGLSFDAVGGLSDPKSAGGTGDIVLTAPAGTVGASYTIVMQLAK
jgi:hypothetical protein